MKQYIKRVMAFLLCMAVMCSLPVAVQAEEIDGYTRMADSGQISLWLNKTTTDFYVQDNNTKTKQLSSPSVTENDAIAHDGYKLEMKAALVLELWDAEKSLAETKNSQALCVMQGRFEIKDTDGGFITEYYFKSYGIRIALSVALREGRLAVSIDPASIQEEQAERYQLTAVSVLPHFLSAVKDSEGYFILPDGCGEKMDYQSDKALYASYDKKVYGKDLTQNLLLKDHTGYDITCPYLCAVTPSAGVLAVPVEGDSLARVIANPAAKISEYTNVYFKFEYRTSDIAIIGDSSGSTRSPQMFNMVSFQEKVTLEYSFIFENITPHSLATLYSDYLFQNREEDAPRRDIVFDIYGMVTKKETFLGIPYTDTKILSKGKDILSFAQQNTFENAVLNLKNVTKEQRKNTINTSVQPIGGIMSGKSFKSLNEQQDMKVYVDINPLTFQKNSFSANAFFDASKTIYHAPAYLFSFLESTRLINKNVKRSLLLQPEKVGDIVDSILKSAKKNKVSGISSSVLGSVMYTHYNEKNTSQQSRAAFANASKALSENASLMLANPGVYAYPYVETILDLPVSSSQNDIGDGTIPFLQMAMGTRVNYTTEPINLSRNANELFLKALLTGASLHYSFALTDTEELIDTELNALYSADYNYHKDTVKRQYSQFKDLRAKTENSALVDYEEVSETVTKARFANGTTVTVDFSTGSVTVA